MFLRYLLYKKKLFALLLLFFALFASIYFLYGVSFKYFFYPFVLCLSIFFIFIIFDYIGISKKQKTLEITKKQKGEFVEFLPESESILEDEYKEIIKIMSKNADDKTEEKDRKYNDMIDYYTVWAHQIKTPIASMKIKLQNEDTPQSRDLKNDLFKIENYADMVMTFLRLDSSSTDYIFKNFDLDVLLKSCVKKFSGEFIARRLSLNLEKTDFIVLTDEKWLSFVIEQVLSNALKYTNEGTISIYLENSTLCIKDTGIGILPEDLPRIFEKGYTGSVGRTEKSASGIGLYLCKRICDNLGHKISIESKVGEGTTVKIGLESKKTLFD